MTETTQNDVQTPSLMVIAVEVGDDEYEMLNRLFTGQGTKIGRISNFQDVLVAASKKKIDIVFLPIAFNEERDLVVLKNLRTLQPEMCIVLLSDYQHKALALQYLAAGYANEQLLLPMEPAIAEEFVRRIVKARLDFRYQTLQSALASFVNLPVPERFQSRLQQLLRKEGVSLHEIITEMEKNPALVAKILRVVNSVHYATRAAIVSLREAIIFIGLDYLETLVMAVDLFERFAVGRNAAVRVLYEKLWDSSLRRALIAKNIAEKSDLVSEASTIHVASLLQDIGLLARLCIEPQKYTAMMEHMQREQISQYIAEFRTFATTHDEIGSALLRRWNFPQDVVFAVANHHGETFGNDIVRIVQIADALDPLGCLEPHDEIIIPDVVEWAERLESILERVREQAMV